MFVLWKSYEMWKSISQINEILLRGSLRSLKTAFDWFVNRVKVDFFTDFSTLELVQMSKSISQINEMLLSCSLKRPKSDFGWFVNRVKVDCFTNFSTLEVLRNVGIDFSNQ